MEVYPNQVIDYKALCGDTSDNIPGVKGIGPKTAAGLLNEYQTLENIYKNIDNITKKSVKEKLIEHKGIAELSQFLATIKTDVEIDFDFANTCLEIEKKNNVIEFFNKVQFFSFVKNIDNLLKPFLCKDEAGQNITAGRETSNNIDEKEASIVKFKEDEPETNNSNPIQGSLFGILEQPAQTQNNKPVFEKTDFETLKTRLNEIKTPLSFLIDNDTVYFAADKCIF